MVMGTTRSACKSWLTTTQCRHYGNQDLKVAPFKAQKHALHI